MISGKIADQSSSTLAYLAAGLLALSLSLGTVWAQVTASVTGTVKDASGAVVSGATITVSNVESGLKRAAESDDSGGFTVPSLPVGQYEVTAEKSGFKQGVRRGITLAVAQQAVINLVLEVGNVAQQVTVTGEAPIVNTTTSPTSGLVSEKEVKDLPLNGRSFDQLLTLNTGIINNTSNTAGGTTLGNFFSVAGRRPDENRFLINGIDYLGTNNSGSVNVGGGASGQLLGVDAVREFNVVQNAYGAEFGKYAGGQISIVTTSGTNQLHGDVFEFLRNSIFDARNFFDQPRGLRIPPFKRNQFGGALGGPLKKDKLFLFGNYEGFRQRLGISSVAVVPDADARRGFLPCVASGNPVCPAGVAIGTPTRVTGLDERMLPFANSFWPAPNGAPLGIGYAFSLSNPLNRIQEDFGLTRFDFNASEKDSLSINYLIDRGENDLPVADPNFLAVSTIHNQVLGLQETHVFSPTVLNVASLGFSRGLTIAGNSPAVAIPSSLLFVSGQNPGSLIIGGAANASGTGTITSAAGTGIGYTIRNLFSVADDVHFIKGIHSLSAGVWIQRVQQNSSGPAATTAGTATFPTLVAFLTDAPPTFAATPNPTNLGFRSTLAAWYVQDEIKLKPNLTLRLGLRDEMTNGWNESHCRAANYDFDSNGIIITNPFVGCSALKENNAKALWQPRAGLAWDPTGKGTWAVRAAAGIYNDLQDAFGLHINNNPPFNAKLSVTNLPLLNYIPVLGGTQPPPNCSTTQGPPCSTFSPAGVEPAFHTPTVEQWSFTVERQITKDLMVQVGYMGSEAYHTMNQVDANEFPPQVCSNPAGCLSGGTLGSFCCVPQGTKYQPPVTGRPNPFLGPPSSEVFFEGTSSYHALNVSLLKRYSQGLTFKVNYTFSKILDLNSAGSSVAAQNEPQTDYNIYDLKLSKGPASYNLAHQFNANFSYELPFGRGKHWGSGASGIADKLIGGWQWNGILTAQGGFPFTPQAGSNRSGTGDANNPDTPNWNTGRTRSNATSGVSAGCAGVTGGFQLGTPNHYYDPCAFLLPFQGTYGNVGRSSFVGPGLTTLDTSLFKKLYFKEKWNLEFRAEAFNVLNHSNFGVPNATVFSGTAYSPTAGVITKTATTSRQLQFALKLIF